MFLHIQAGRRDVRSPSVNQHFRILSFVAQGASQAAVIFVRVSQDNAANVGDTKARFPQPFAQSLDGFLGFRPVSMRVIGSSAIR